ncbi:TniB family NTP-binding protein [Sulfurovum sp.]|uniref:TniB family NTP-binding protein n=1 Tax=Sulfurovum sp. TaxID=1969726 RepID=UPI00356231E6
MNESYNHLHDEFKPLMLFNDEKRIESLYEDMWINYPRSEEIIQLLSQMMNRPKKPRMPGLLLIGESNMGKTSIIHRFVALHPDMTIEDDMEMTRVQKPVMHAIMRGSEEKDLYIAILDKFWVPFRPTDPKAKLRHQLVSLMLECNVKILILDEIHNLLRGTAVKQRIMMDTIKTLSVELMIPIIGVGTQDAAMVLVTDPQHTSRFDIVKLPKWKMDKNFRALLVAFEKRLPLKHPSRLDSKEKAPLLYAISRGNLGDLHRLLIECASYAIKHGVEEITVDIIDKHRWVKPTDTHSAREIVFDTD